MSRYYDDDEDDDPYTPRIGPAAMPSPRSKYAPYYSGRANTFEDFLEEFEGRAYDCVLTDPQRVDVIIRYVDPSLRDFWRSISGYHSRDWPQLRQSLVDVFGSITPRHQVRRQKLLKYVQVASRSRMFCEDDVLCYYRQFLCYSAPLVHAGHLSEEERNTAFWCGFHPEDRKVLQPRLLGKNPFQPPDIPFHFEDVFGCARAAFAYDDYSFSPWSHAEQFKPPSVRREQPIVEPIPRDAYGFRAVTRVQVVASNAETTTTLNSSLPSYSMPDSDFPHSLISPSESPYTQAPSVTVDQPETAYTLSSTLLPSSSFATQSHTPSLVYSATDNDPIFTPTFPISTSTLLPSAFPTPTPASSLAHSAADEIPGILSTFPSPSTTPTPFSIPTSDFEYLPSATVNQPEPVATLSSMSPSSSISSTFLLSPARLATEDRSEPEPVPALFASVHALPFVPLHVHSVTDSDPLFASTPPSASPTSSTCLPSVTEEQPEPEPEPIPLIAPASTFASTPLSSSSSTFLPTPVISATDCQSESEPASTSESSVSKFGLSPRALPLPPDQKLDLPPRTLSLPPDQTLTPHSSSPLLEISTLGSLPVSLSPDQSFESLSFKSEALGQSSGSCELVSSTLVFAADVVTLSHPELPLSPGEPILFLLSSLDAPLNAPILPRSTPPRLPELKTIGSVSTQLEVTPSPASPTVPPVPRQVTTAQWLLYLDPQLPDWQELSVVYKVSSIKPPALAPRPSLFHSSPSLRLFGTSIRFGFTLALVTTAVLASILNIPATVSTFAHKYWSKQEDIGNNRIGTLNTSSHDVFAQRLRLGQYTPRGTRFVFDPGGQASSSRLFSAHEDFASASRRYATASSRTSPSPFPFQSTIPFSIPEV